MERYSVFLPDHLRLGLKLLKKRTGLSESGAIREALARFLKRQGIDTARFEKGGTRRFKV